MSGHRLKLLCLPADPVTKAAIKDGAKDFRYTFLRKDANGVPRRYMAGVSSGMAVDAHGERMSDKCIKDFSDQTTQKDIPLYENHGKDPSEAIGVLTKSEILPNGDWGTEYRLWDESDDVPQSNKDRADHIWKMANGLPPYNYKRQYGFSIEGYIPDNQVRNDGTSKIIEKVDLDPGVALVTKPAYQTSVAHAIAKALGIKRTTKGALASKIEQRQKEYSLAELKWEIEESFRTATQEIKDSNMNPEEKRDALSDLYDEYKSRMLNVETDYNPGSDPNTKKSGQTQQLNAYNTPNASLPGSVGTGEILGSSNPQGQSEGDFQNIDTKDDVTMTSVKSRKAALLALVRRASNLLELARKSRVKKSNQDVLTVLNDVISQLMLLVQAESSSTGPEVIQMSKQARRKAEGASPAGAREPFDEYESPKTAMSMDDLHDDQRLIDPHSQEVPAGNFKSKANPKDHDPSKFGDSIDYVDPGEGIDHEMKGAGDEANYLDVTDDGNSARQKMRELSAKLKSIEGILKAEGLGSLSVDDTEDLANGLTIADPANSVTSAIPQIEAQEDLVGKAATQILRHLQARAKKGERINPNTYAVIQGLARKSAAGHDPAVYSAINGLSAEVSKIGKAVDMMLKGFGVEDALKPAPQSYVPTSKGMAGNLGGASNDDMAQLIAKAIVAAQSSTPAQSNSPKAMKSLSDQEKRAALSSIFQR